MIGFLRGLLMVKKPPFLLIDVGGVGYEVQASMHTFYHLPAVGSTASLYIHFVVREDAQLLYGFYSEQERLVFRELIKITGVGGKLALAILSGMNITDLFTCIKTRNYAQLVRIPGIGKKTAERLVVEMQGKLDRQLSGEQKFSEVILTGNVTNSEQHMQDAIDALMALGYKQPEANGAVMKIADASYDSETLIRLALQDLGKFSSP
jgi:Holliday junction DNA helicase RuvA